MAQETPKIDASPRERFGSRYAQRLRREGKLPAVVYGHQEEPSHVAVDRHEMLHLIEEGAHLFELKHNGKSETCLVKAVQYDYLGTNPIHVDLIRTSATEEVSVMVPVHVVGNDESPGLKESGAFVEQPLVDLEVVCRANTIPDHLTADISELNLWDSLTVADLKLPAGVKTEHDPEDTVAAIHQAKEAPEEEEAEAEAASAEPEVIAEKEKEGEEAADESADKGESGGE